MRERFLLEIAARVPRERITEIHLFAPLRQGGVETGVAVVAVAPEPTEPDGTAATSPARHTVYAATYRATLKGPERGKWEFAVTLEADAPLLSVDAVVRGVQRRAGEEGETERLHGETLAQLLGAPAASRDGDR